MDWLDFVFLKCDFLPAIIVSIFECCVFSGTSELTSLDDCLFGSASALPVEEFSPVVLGQLDASTAVGQSRVSNNNQGN